MTGGKSQSDRVLIDAHSRSAKARTDAIIAEVNAKYQPQWDAFMAKLEKPSPSNWTAQEKHDATVRLEGKV